MAVSILQPMSLFERVAFRSADHRVAARPLVLPGVPDSSCTALDLSKSRAYDAALEILGAYKLTGNFHVNLEIVLGALGARNEVTFDVRPGLPYHRDCRHVEFQAKANVSPERFGEIIRSIRARLAFDATH